MASGVPPKKLSLPLYKKEKNKDKELEFQKLIETQVKLVSEMPYLFEKLTAFCTTTFFCWLPDDLQKKLCHFVLAEQYDVNSKYITLFSTVGDYLYDSN